MPASIRSALSLPLRTVRFVLAAAFVVVILYFLILFVLQFIHSPKLDNHWFVVQFRAWGNPLIAGSASYLGLEWPAPSRSLGLLLPLPFALVAWVVKMIVDALSSKPRAGYPSRYGLPARKSAGPASPASRDSNRRSQSIRRRPATNN